MSYQWYAEYDPFFSVGGAGPSGSGGIAHVQYQKYVDGSSKLGPKGERARCGWFVNDDLKDTSTIASTFTDPETPNYVCSKSAPRSATAPAKAAATAGGMSRNTKIAIGVGVGLAAIVLLRRKR